MRVGFYDRLPIDDIPRYRQQADIILCSRFRPHLKMGHLDAVITTYSRPPDTGVPVITMLASDRATSHLQRSPVYRAPAWSLHDTAAYALTALFAWAPVERPVAVIGRGRIGQRVYRYLRRQGYAARLIGHEESWLPGDYGALTLHTGNIGQYLDDALPYLHGAVIVNTAQPDAISRPALVKALDNGNLRMAVVDGGPRIEHRRVIWTPHKAWDGERSKVLRPLAVCRVLDLLSRNALTSLDSVPNTVSRSRRGIDATPFPPAAEMRSK